MQGGQWKIARRCAAVLQGKPQRADTASHGTSLRYSHHLTMEDTMPKQNTENRQQAATGNKGSAEREPARSGKDAASHTKAKKRAGAGGGKKQARHH